MRLRDRVHKVCIQAWSSGGDPQASRAGSMSTWLGAIGEKALISSIEAPATVQTELAGTGGLVMLTGDATLIPERR